MHDFVGPVLPGWKKSLPRSSVLPYWVTGGIRAVLRDIPGAVVEVEDTLPSFLPKVSPTMATLERISRLRLHGRVASPNPPAIMLPGMNGGEIWSGGNRVHKTYPIGGVVL